LELRFTPFRSICSLDCALRSTDLRDGHKHHLPWSNTADSGHRGRHQWAEILESETSCSEDDHAKTSVSKVLLVLEVLIGRDEDIESALGGTLKQLAVLRPQALLAA
jgi:hypothetical protein